METWKRSLSECVDSWDKAYLVSSPDIDGLLTAAILADAYGTKLIGLYTTTHLLLFERFEAQDALCAMWVDQDINHPSIQCVGQHIVSHSNVDNLPTRHPQCFNPNIWAEQTYERSFGGTSSTTRDKYPFATCHLFLSLCGFDAASLNDRETALLAHADGTFANVHIYPKNCSIWKNMMFSKSHLFNTIMPGYAANSPVVREHTNLVEQLESVGIKKAGSRTRQRTLPDELADLTGHQGIQYAIHHRDEPFLDKLNQIIAVVGKDTRFKLPSVNTINGQISGTVDQEYPNHILKGEFDDFIAGQRVFSHAFTSQTILRFTTMDGTPLEPPTFGTAHSTMP